MTKVFICKKCGATMYKERKPKKCWNCKRKLGELEPIGVYQC